MLSNKVKKIRCQEDFKGIKEGEEVKIYGNLETFVGMTTLNNKEFGVTLFHKKDGIYERRTNFSESITLEMGPVGNNYSDYQKYKSLAEVKK